MVYEESTSKQKSAGFCWVLVGLVGLVGQRDSFVCGRAHSLSVWTSRVISICYVEKNRIKNEFSIGAAK
jgi:hypothetical protein